MKPPSPEQIAWLQQSVATTGNTEHQFLLYLLHLFLDLGSECKLAALAHEEMTKRLTALEAVLLPQPAEPPAGATGDLSRVADAVLNAFLDQPGDGNKDLAAALRALADQAGSAKHWHVDELRAIAAELEGES